MKIVKIWNDNPSDRQLNEIVGDLDNGCIVIYPTDTLYAIGCDALNVKAIDKICKLKNINPEKTNLSIICSDISQASEYVRCDDKSFRLLKDNTPGPFTFLFKASSSLPKAFKGRKIVGVRIPDNNTVSQIVKQLGRPILTTSIEFIDEDYARNVELITETYYDKVDVVIDGGDGGLVPSTIVDCTENIPEIIREGKGVLK